LQNPEVSIWALQKEDASRHRQWPPLQRRAMRECE